jgi:hypothetical protein
VLRIATDFSQSAILPVEDADAARRVSELFGNLMLLKGSRFVHGGNTDHISMVLSSMVLSD